MSDYADFRNFVNSFIKDVLYGFLDSYTNIVTTIKCKIEYEQRRLQELEASYPQNFDNLSELESQNAIYTVFKIDGEIRDILQKTEELKNDFSFEKQQYLDKHQQFLQAINGGTWLEYYVHNMSRTMSDRVTIIANVANALLPTLSETMPRIVLTGLVSLRLMTYGVEHVYYRLPIIDVLNSNARTIEAVEEAHKNSLAKIYRTVVREIEHLTTGAWVDSALELERITVINDILLKLSDMDGKAKNFSERVHEKIAEFRHDNLNLTYISMQQRMVRYGSGFILHETQGIMGSEMSPDAIAQNDRISVLKTEHENNICKLLECYLVVWQEHLRLADDFEDNILDVVKQVHEITSIELIDVTMFISKLAMKLQTFLNAIKDIAKYSGDLDELIIYEEAKKIAKTLNNDVENIFIHQARGVVADSLMQRIAIIFFIVNDTIAVLHNTMVEGFAARRDHVANDIHGALSEYPNNIDAGCLRSLDDIAAIRYYRHSSIPRSEDDYFSLINFMKKVISKLIETQNNDMEELVAAHELADEPNFEIGIFDKVKDEVRVNILANKKDILDFIDQMIGTHCAKRIEESSLRKFFLALGCNPITCMQRQRHSANHFNLRIVGILKDEYVDGNNFFAHTVAFGHGSDTQKGKVTISRLKRFIEKFGVSFEQYREIINRMDAGVIIDGVGAPQYAYRVQQRNDIEWDRNDGLGLPGNAQRLVF